MVTAGITSLDSVSTSSVKHRIGAPVFANYGSSLIDTLSQIYPEYNWDKSKSIDTKIPTEPGFWKDEV